MKPQVNCSLVQRWIELSLDDELSVDLEAQLDGHLDSCEPCRNRYEVALADHSLLNEELGCLSGTFDELLSERMTEATIVRFEERSASAAFERQRLHRRKEFRRYAVLLLAGIAVFTVIWLGSASLPGLRTESKPIAVGWWKEGEAPVFRSAGGSSERPEGTHRGITGIDTVEVAADAQLHIEYPDGSVATVIGPSRFELRAEEGRRQFRLLDGLAEFWVQPSRRGFYVSTRLAMVRVVGTHFTVQHSDGLDKSGVLVEEGEVRTWCRERPESKLTLSAGDVARVSPRSIQVSHALVPPDLGEERRPVAPDSATSLLRASRTIGGPDSDDSTQSREASQVQKASRSKGLDVPVPSRRRGENH